MAGLAPAIHGLASPGNSVDGPTMTQRRWPHRL